MGKESGQGKGVVTNLLRQQRRTGPSVPWERRERILCNNLKEDIEQRGDTSPSGGRSVDQPGPLVTSASGDRSRTAGSTLFESSVSVLVDAGRRMTRTLTVSAEDWTLDTGPVPRVRLRWRGHGQRRVLRRSRSRSSGQSAGQSCVYMASWSSSRGRRRSGVATSRWCFLL